MIRTLVLLVAAALGGAFAQTAPIPCPAPAAGEAKPWLNPRYTPQCRARFVLDQLKTLDDKFAFLASGGFGPPAPGQRSLMTEMGLPRTGASDGPAGMARGKGVTALPTPLSVAANFDPAMATRFGHLLKKADIERQIASTEAKQARVRELARQGKSLEDIKAPLGEAPATERPPGAAGRGMRLPTLVDVVYSEITAK